ncbi:undecaprenyl-phosphate glucose phosphotransferase [Clostridium sp. DJ247]|uniref:undecaprenyl-phosphate glucose phosphotransferase n=1 Tax=Clostridium sp. DJ247 TaxID=2726188 RepID=UPI001625AB88|nr:undecaprenyl-phosphate glucose phosphotransferase [Clostridium sp. DJ247]MBC2581564.1 undecaprenyl-phosphate glucose phosphotransferase [Clostridium sp. DJ247]
MIKENQRYLNRLLVFLDILCLIFSLVFAWYIRFKSGIVYVSSQGEYLRFKEYLKPVVLMIPPYLILYNAFKLYTPYRFKSMWEETINILKANILGILIFVLLLYLFRYIDYSRYLLAVFIVNCATLMILERGFVRLCLRLMRKKGYNLKHILIIGFSNLTLELLDKIHKNKHWGYNVVGILDDNLKSGKTSLEQSDYSKSDLALDEIAASVEKKVILDGIRSLEEYLNKFHIDEVFITLSIKEYDKLGFIINTCEKSGVRTQIIPDYYKYIPAKPYVEEVDGLPIINIRYVPLDNLLNKFVKRMIDIITSFIAVLIFSPIMLIVSLIIKITSPGPVLFKQQRVGLNRKIFNMYKFRSMHVQKDEEEKIKWTTKNDSRKTKFGSFIRKTSIDELPQLFNVLSGDMSIIGPRPERPYFVDKFKEEIPKYMVKHQVRPGITGWAQVNGWRGDTSIEKRIECDIYYIENWSLWMDMKIMFLTVFKGFVNKNAY